MRGIRATKWQTRNKKATPLYQEGIQLLEQRQTLGGKFGRVVRYASDVAARPGQTLHQTNATGPPAPKATTVAMPTGLVARATGKPLTTNASTLSALIS